MAEAWAATRGKRWRLLGMAFLLGLGVVAVVGVAIALVVLVAVGFQAGTRRCGGVRILVAVPMLLVGYVPWFWVRLRALAGPDPDARTGRRLRRRSAAPSASPGTSSGASSGCCS